MKKELENCSLLDIVTYIIDYDDVKVDVPYNATIIYESVKSQAKHFLLDILITQISDAVYRRIVLDLGLEVTN